MFPESRANFPNDLDFYKASINRLIEFADFEGNSRTLFDALQSALTKQPDLINPLIDRSVQIAQEKLSQDRTQNAAVILPFETALRMVASQDQPELLYPSRWTPKLVIDYLSKNGNEVAQLAGEKTIGRNLPSRAAWMLSVLSKADVLSKKPFFIELGAAGGFILDALKQPSRFSSWLKSTNIPRNPTIDAVDCQETFAGFGADLTPITDIPWAIACLGDDEAMSGLVDFLQQFPQRSAILPGNILDQDIWGLIRATASDAANKREIPVIVASEMLYLISPNERQKALDNIKTLISQTGGYFLRSDSGQHLEIPNLPKELEMMTIGEMRGPDFQLIGPRLGLIGKYCANWEVLKI